MCFNYTKTIQITLIILIILINIILVIILTILIIAVNEIDSATSPRAKEVNIFEVTPPGAAAIIITPTASSGDIGHSLTNMKATIGSNII